MNSRAILAVDLGGTQLRVGRVPLDGGELGEVGGVKRRRSPKGWEELVKVLGPLCAISEIVGCAISIAGVIEKHSTVIESSNLPWLDGRNVRKELTQSLNTRVIVSNDMEAAAEGERKRGVLKYKWAIFDTISTGWGGVLLLNGRIVHGEPGHMNVGLDLPYVCGCGNVGCYEALYAGKAMERRILGHLPKRKIVSDPWHYFYEALETRAGWSVSLLEEWAEGVGKAWANVLNRIRPMQAIVYMGTTAENLVPKVEPLLRATLRRICKFPDHKRDEFPIQKAKYAERSLLGAAVLWSANKP